MSTFNDSKMSSIRVFSQQTGIKLHLCRRCHGRARERLGRWDARLLPLRCSPGPLPACVIPSSVGAGPRQSQQMKRTPEAMLLERLQGRVLRLLQLLEAPALLGLWLHNASLASAFTWPAPRLCPPLLRTLAIGFRATQVIQDALTSRSLMPFHLQRPFSPNELTFTASEMVTCLVEGGGGERGEHHSTTP